MIYTPGKCPLLADTVSRARCQDGRCSTEETVDVHVNMVFASLQKLACQILNQSKLQMKLLKTQLKCVIQNIRFMSTVLSYSRRFKCSGWNVVKVKQNCYTKNFETISTMTDS